MERRRAGVLRLMIRLSWQYLLLLLLYDRGPAMVSGRPLQYRNAMQNIQGPIKTIVVLVMENRSFDHILGWMKTMQPDLDGVTGRESNRVNPSDANSPPVYFSDRAEFVDPDPGHSFQAIRDQIFGPGGDTRADPPPMDGFAAQAETIQRNLSARVMAGFRPEVLPVYAALAMEFAVCDRWFAAVPASTQPNRLFVHSGTSHGATGNVASQLAAGYPQRTIFDSVHDAGLSFSVYYQNLPTVLFYRNLRQLKYVTRLIPYGPYFRQHAHAGTLPNYVVIEPRYFDVAGRPANDDHPSHDVAQGQQLVKEVYETLRASPQWNQTLLVVTYDEHGGFFDHVPTPVRGVPSPDGIVGPAPFNFTFDRLGVRVPAFLISPWINKGTVLHAPNGPSASSQFEHSSIPATVKKLFNLPSPFLTRRDAWAGTFENLLYQRSIPRTDCPEVLPSPPWSLRHSPPDESRLTSEFQQELVQLAAAIKGRFSADAHELPPMNVKDANDFVEDAVARFMEAGKAAAEAGLDEETIVNNPV